MEQLVLTLSLIAVVYFIGYYIGRKQVVDEIKRLTKDIDKEDKE